MKWRFKKNLNLTSSLHVFLFHFVHLRIVSYLYHFAFRNIALKTFHSQGGWILLAIQNRRRREEESERGRARKEHLIATDDFVLATKGLSITVEGCKLVRVVLFF